MSKRNRENRARKQRAAQKRKPSVANGEIPPIPPGLMGSGTEAVRARRRLAIMMPFLFFAKQNPYTPGMELPNGSIIIGTGTDVQGYIERAHVSQIIAETQRELGVAFDEIFRMLVDSEASGLIKIIDSEASEEPPQASGESAT